MAAFDSDRVVDSMRNSLGRFCSGVRPLGEQQHGHVPVFCQLLDASTYSLAFEPGSAAYQVLGNDQSRFSPPRSLPPILDLELPDRESGFYVLTRYAYSEGAFQLLEDRLAEGHVFGMNEFLGFAWSMAQSLAYLHRHGIVHGQWNARSVIVIPTERHARPFFEIPQHRFELINTGVCFRDPAAIPEAFLERGYYPPEILLSGSPDYGALDAEGDVYCFAAFLKDLMQRASSAEELPSQARGILAELQRQAGRRGFKTSPDSLQDKEMEILDHLYTIKVGSESLIQDGLRLRADRCTAAQLLASVKDLHQQALSYLERLIEAGFEPVNVFGEDLQHYTTFDLSISPPRVNSYEDSEVVLTGRDLPHEFVRLTLNERHEGVQVLSALPERIEFRVQHGLPSGSYRVSINNRRTNGSLEVFSPEWRGLAPAEIHQPWDGFGNIRLMVRGTRLPEHVPYVLHPLRHEGEEHLRESEENETVAAIVVCRLEDKDSEGDELEECLQLVFPANTPAQSYALFANDLPTGLEVRVLSQLPEPVIRAGGLEPAAVKNHRPWSLSLTGRNFHPLMVVDLGEEAPKGLRLHVASSTRARLLLPRRFPRGTHRLRLNYQETEVELEVAESRWNAASPAGLKILRNQEEPSAVQLTGTGLPLLAEEEDGYSLSDAGGNPIVEGVVKAEEVLEERSHRLLLSPRLPRGRTRIHFGELDTGLDLHVSRQLTRKAWAVAASILVAALAIPGILIQRNFAPHIGSMDPQFVYSLGKTEVEITGAHLARVELIGPGQRAEFTLREDPDEPGLYHFTAAGLAEGKYRVRPIGPLYGASPGEHQLTVRSPILRIEPTTLHRLAGGSLRVDTSDDFDVTSLEELGLLRGDGSLLAELPVADGRIEIPAGSFQRADEGEYEIAIDGVRPQKARPDGQERSPLTLSIVGPRLEGVTPNPASLDSQGRIKLRLEGQHLLSDMWFGLVAEDGATRHALSSAGPDRFVARVPPGTYRLLFGTAEDPLEEFQGPALTVLPQPEISEVLPSKLTPGRTTRLTFKGTNLGALQRIVLKPVEAGHESLEIPLERGRAKLDGLESSYESAVTLQPGTYRIEPAGSELTIDVFDDCKKALAAFETGGDPQDLLRCLETGRPPQEVVKQAADLFFDRGLFAEARLLYQKQDDLRSRFRASFVGAYLQREPVAWFDLEADEEQALYGVAAMRLGWSGAKSPEFPEQLPLPWELEFVRGLTIPDPSVAVGAFSRAVREKTKACRGFEIKGFGPAKDALAKARLDLAIQLIRSTEIAKARALLEEKLLGDSDAWQRLGPEHQDLALFWHGHVSLWYRGDEKEATRSFQRATEPESGASLCRLYLDALRTESPGQEAAPEEASTKKALARVRPSPRDEWKRAFVRVFSLYKEITVGPNYNLLTERGEGYLTEDERGKSIQLHKLLRRLEQLSPEDPFVHDALLYYLRNAQRITWPAQKGGSRAAGHGDRLRRISLSVELEPVRQYYLLLGELGPYAFPQITALPRSEHKAHSDRIREVLKGKLPAALRLSAERLRKKFLGLPVAWWNPKTEK